MKKILLSLGAVICAGIACFGPKFAHAETPALRLVAHFNGTTADSSANHYPADAGGSNANITYEPGKLGEAGVLTALHVGGGVTAQYFTYPAIGTANFSLNAWVKLANADSPEMIVDMSTNGALCDGGYELAVMNRHASFSICGAAGDAVSLEGSELIDDNDWHLLEATRSATLISLYVDGKLSATATSDAVLNLSDFGHGGPSIQGLTLGGRDTDISIADQERYTGDIDEFVIFDRALSAQEAACFYNVGAGKEIDQDESVCADTVVPLPPPPPPADLKEPVVIIPGIMGSQIDRANDGQEAWPNAGKMGSLSEIGSGDPYLDALKLDSGGRQIAAMTVPDIVRTVISSLPNVPFHGDFYQPLIDAFVKDGYVENKDLFMSPYDWRLDLSAQTDAIGAKIAMAASSSPDGKVNIIAHSMGGLLLKKYLSGIQNVSSIDKVILAGVPQLGSPEAFEALNYGESLGIPILSAQKIKEITQNMPSLYQLLPGRRYIQTTGGYVEDFRQGRPPRVLDYDGTASLMLGTAGDSRNSALISQADAFHQNLDAQAVRAPNIYNIVGCLDPTISQFNLYDNGFADVRRSSGDGTVPETSAMNLANDFSNYFVLGNETGIDHQGLVKDQRPLALIKNIIDGTAAAEPLPQGISNTAADCLTPRSQPQKETVIEFSTHSPVALNVYDSQNRHTGPNPAGYVDLGIPGSTYMKMGENSFVTVPASDTYKVVDLATATGTFEMLVRGYAGSAVTREASYLSIPLPNSSTRAELDFSGFGNDMTLKLDKNGNGRADARYQPNAVLSRSNGSDDMTPPTLAMPLIPPQLQQHSSLKLIFGASDAGSGIAMINARLNGAPVASGKDIVFTKPGKYVFSLQATDKAGNPSAGETDFTVQAVFSLSPSADTYVRANSANENLGRESDLRVSEKERALLKFDTDKLRGKLKTAQVVSASIEFPVLRDSSNWGKDGTLDLVRMSRDWTERGATWNCANDTSTGNNKPDCSGNSWNMANAPLPFAGSISTSTMVGDGLKGTISLNVTEDVKHFLDGTLPNYGWILKKHDEGLPGVIAFPSGETRNAPKLTVTYKL